MEGMVINMQQVAVVKRLIDTSRAEVVVVRQGACGGECAKCEGCGPAPAPIRVVARNMAGAKAGDKVIIASSSSRVLSAAAIVYMLPFVLFFLAYGISYSFGYEAQATLAGGAGFGIAMLAALMYNQYIKNKKILPEYIVKIVGQKQQ